MNPVPGSPVFTLPGSGAVAAGLSERCVSHAHVMPARLEASLRITESSGMLGPLLSLEGSLVLSGLRASVILRDHPRESPEAPHEVVRPISLVPSGERIPVNAGHPLRGIRGPSLITIRLMDSEGRTLAEEHEIGECVEGTLEARLPFPLAANAVVWVAAREWAASAPRYGVTGQVVFPRGVTVRLGFHPLGSGRSGIGEGATEAKLVDAGLAWHVPEKTFEGNSSEASWVYVQFSEPGARRVDAEYVVGHCVLA